MSKQHARPEVRSCSTGREKRNMRKSREKWEKKRSEIDWARHTRQGILHLAPAIERMIIASKFSHQSLSWSHIIICWGLRTLILAAFSSSKYFISIKGANLEEKACCEPTLGRWCLLHLLLICAVRQYDIYCPSTLCRICLCFSWSLDSFP